VVHRENVDANDRNGRVKETLAGMRSDKTLGGRRQESASDLLVAGALCCRYGLPLMKNCRLLRNKIATKFTKPVANLSFPQKTVINRSLKKKYLKSLLDTSIYSLATTMGYLSHRLAPYVVIRAS
jgi:hypothetical protein